MGPDREVSLGEVADKLDVLTSDVREYQRENKDTFARRDLVDQQIGNLAASQASDTKRHDSEIRELEQRLTVIGRTAITAVLLPILVFIVTIFIIAVLKP